MLYPIMFALALFLNMATALGFAATGALGLGFIFCGLAIVAHGTSKRKAKELLANQ